MLCPSCSSDNCQRLAVVFSKDIMLGTSGINASMLAHQIQPPTRKKLKNYGYLAFFAFFFLFAQDNGIKVTAFLTVLFCVFKIVMAIKYNKGQYLQDLHEWNNKWLCNRCGTIYLQGSNY